MYSHDSLWWFGLDSYCIHNDEKCMLIKLLFSWRSSCYLLFTSLSNHPSLLTLAPDLRVVKLWNDIRYQLMISFFPFIFFAVTTSPSTTIFSWRLCTPTNYRRWERPRNPTRRRATTSYCWSDHWSRSCQKNEIVKVVFSLFQQIIE